MLVSLELPGNIKVWLRCQCQVIFAVKQSVSFYNHGEDRKERICPDANVETKTVFKDKRCELVKTRALTKHQSNWLRSNVPPCAPGPSVILQSGSEGMIMISIRLDII